MAFYAKKWMDRVAAAAVMLGALASAARAAEQPEGLGKPVPWQFGFQLPATPVMENIESFHGWVFWIITLIVLFVLALLTTIVLRFNKTANPVPSRVTHHTGLEIAWTVLPIVILVFIAIPSFRLLYLEQVIPPADITLKATGYQWNWDYEYPDHGGVEILSKMVKEQDLKPGQPRLLTVDNEVVLPVNKVIRVQVTGADVIHSFAVPSFGIKIDAIPGRLNETWFKATREGMYYGQCSELCGTEHAFMPIAVRIVSDDEFNKWISTKKAEMNGQTPNKVASAATAIAN